MATTAPQEFSTHNKDNEAEEDGARRKLREELLKSMITWHEDVSCINQVEVIEEHLLV